MSIKFKEKNIYYAMYINTKLTVLQTKGNPEWVSSKMANRIEIKRILADFNLEVSGLGWVEEAEEDKSHKGRKQLYIS